LAEDFAQEFYWKMREAVTGRLSRDAKRIKAKATKNSSQPFDKGRDPVSAGASLEGILKDFRWEARLAEADLFNRWGELVGEVNGLNSYPETLVNGVLTVRCKSTAWATQLRLMHDQLLEKVNEKYGDLGIASLKLLGPDAPSWKKGPRSVPGRGPRDTYG
jgi:predicted nucleic acid-binding Zn ribbon protein